MLKSNLAQSSFYGGVARHTESFLTAKAQRKMSLSQLLRRNWLIIYMYPAVSCPHHIVILRHPYHSAQPIPILSSHITSHNSTIPRLDHSSITTPLYLTCFTYNKPQPTHVSCQWSQRIIFLRSALYIRIVRMRDVVALSAWSVSSKVVFLITSNRRENGSCYARFVENLEGFVFVWGRCVKCYDEEGKSGMLALGERSRREDGQTEVRWTSMKEKEGRGGINSGLFSKLGFFSIWHLLHPTP